MGPVSGPEKKVLYDDGKYHQHDYVAKPDYHFAYGIEDPKSKVRQSRQETRHGDTVEGEYRCDSNAHFFETIHEKRNYCVIISVFWIRMENSEQ